MDVCVCAAAISWAAAVSYFRMSVFTTRRYANAVPAVALSLSVSLRLSLVGVLPKPQNKSGWVLARGLFQPILHCVVRNFG